MKPGLYSPWSRDGIMICCGIIIASMTSVGVLGIFLLYCMGY